MDNLYLEHKYWMGTIYKNMLEGFLEPEIRMIFKDHDDNSIFDERIEHDVDNQIYFDDITVLRYIFPLAYLLNKKQVIDSVNKLKVYIDINIDESKLDDDKKIQQELYAIKSRMLVTLRYMKEIDYIELYINNRNIQLDYGSFNKNDSLKVGRIMPIIQVAGNREDVLDYRFLNESFIRGNTGEGRKQQFDSFIEELLTYVEEYKRYRGHRENKSADKSTDISADNKLILRDTLMETVNKWMPIMSRISFVIWLMILRELIKSGQLINFGIDTILGDEQKELFSDMLIRSRIDATVYGESGYQIIENACIHSDDKMGWFGLRMYHAGDNSDDVVYRKLLSSKYNNDRLADDFPNSDLGMYLEFYIADCSDCGIMDNYNNRIIKDDKGNNDNIIQNIKELFNIREINAAELLRIVDREKREKELNRIIRIISSHYGLRIFKRFTRVNKSRAVIFTPQSDGETCIYDVGLDDSWSETCDSYGTFVNSLFPLSFSDSHLNVDVTNYPQIIENYDTPITKMDYLSEQELMVINRQKSFVSLDEKYRDIDRLREMFRKYLPLYQSASDQPETICVVKVPNDHYILEMMSKALFEELAVWKFDSFFGRNKSPNPVAFAFLFQDLEGVYEFIRFYSIMYNDKKPDQNNYFMQNVQIALGILDNRHYDIHTILAGQYITTAYYMARQFAYYHSVSVLEYLSVIAYISAFDSEQREVSENIKIIPFDLYLPDTFSGVSGRRDLELNWNGGMFSRRMEKALQTDMRKTGFGMLLNDVHVRLGSKVHLNNFYEAELLFHDILNVRRFATLLMNEIIYKDRVVSDGDSILILGYEKYSVLLVHQLQMALEKRMINADVKSAVIYDEKNGDDVSISLLYNEDEEKELSENVKVISVLPVGTTLSTVYKMHNQARRHKKWQTVLKNDRFAANYCIVLVGNVGNVLNDIQKRYWADVDNNSLNIVTLQKERNTSDKVEEVKYMIKVDSSWNDPYECKYCKLSRNNLIPVIDVKNPDMLPSSIFPMWNKREGTFDKLFDIDKFKRKEENNKKETKKSENQKDTSERNNPIKLVVPPMVENRLRIKGLYNHVSYAHGYNSSDHFQFFVNFPNFFSRNKDYIVEWLSSIKEDIEPGAINIVVSPLDINNSEFLNAVMNNVFPEGAYCFYFDIIDGFREEIRTKFNYIAQDYRMFNKNGLKTKIKIFFVDNSLVSGNLINRAWMMVKMLLTQSHIYTGGWNGFDKIFLMINRSSYDTIHSYVENPQEDLLAYISFAFPSYNMNRDTCPACIVAEKYSLLEKRTTTEPLSKEFARLVDKHGKQTFSEYRQSIDKEILEKTSYFGWVRQWLSINDFSKDGDGTLINYMDNIIKDTGLTKKYISPKEEIKHLSKLSEDDKIKADYECAKRLNERINEYIKQRLSNVELRKGFSFENFDDQQEILRELSSIRIIDIYDKDDDERAQVVKLINDYLIKTRDFMRLYCMQLSYENLHSNKPVPIRDIINSVLYKVGGKNKKTELIVKNCEWIISFIKVLSREQFANYFPNRKEILNIIYDLFLMLDRSNKIEDSEDNDSIVNTIKILNEFKPNEKSKDKLEYKGLYEYLRYQLFTTFFHRMADLQLYRIVSDECINKYIELYMEGNDQCIKTGKKESVNGGDIYIPIVNYPDWEYAIVRFIKSIKAATMASHDDNPCIYLEYMVIACRNNIKGNSLKGRMKENVINYIYLENTRMLYTGMNDIEMVIESEQDKQLAADSMSKELVGYPISYKAEIKAYDNIIKKELDDIYEIGPGEQITGVLYQNMLGNFCAFCQIAYYEENHPLDDDKIKYMYLYYRKLHMLSRRKDMTELKDSIPYIYEDICRYICGLSKYKMCYIVNENNSGTPVFIAQSGYYVPYVEQDIILDTEWAGRIIQEFKREGLGTDKNEDSLDSKDETSLIKTLDIFNRDIIVCEYTMGEGIELETLSIKISFETVDQNTNIFYIILQKESDRDNKRNNDEIKTEALDKARNVLFMRKTLVDVLKRDYVALMNQRFDYSYVGRYSLTSEIQKSPAVLHLSDIHIVDELESSSMKEIAMEIGEVIKHSDIESADLILISGDIVDGRDASAPIMEKRYACAKKLLNRIAISLWDDNIKRNKGDKAKKDIKEEHVPGYLPHDWKKRIIISTGNHDYASMNQYTSVIKKRELAPGLPIEEESSTMSKFTHFIDFLIDYLDIPINALLDNDLNDIRDYRKLNMKILTLNCTGNASPSRTNKLGVKKEKVIKLINQYNWYSDYDNADEKKKPFRICLAHYSPHYKLSYFLDIFQNNIPGWDWGMDSHMPINRLVEDYFLEAVKSEYMLRLETVTKAMSHEEIEKSKNAETEFSKEFASLNAALRALEQDKHRASENKYGDSYMMWIQKAIKVSKEDSVSDTEARKRFVNEIRNNKLYKNMEELAKWIELDDKEKKKNYSLNESVYKMISEIMDCIQMGETDIEEYTDLVSTINDLTHIDLCLSGHIHAYAEYNVDKHDKSIKDAEEDEKNYIKDLVSDKLFYEDTSELQGYLIYDITGKDKYSEDAASSCRHIRLYNGE